MPKRVLDFDAMWGSDKLAACAEWAQAEYAWLYGLADASGCFELTNLRVIWGRVAAIRRNLTIERLEQVFNEFQDKGLLFVWEENGKRYAHWSGSDVPGRLPPPSWRMRLERLAPPLPKQQFAEFMSKFARGRATLPGRFAADPAPSQVACAGSNSIETRAITPGVGESVPGSAGKPDAKDPWSVLQHSLEAPPTQDWNWNGNKKEKREEERKVYARDTQATVALPVDPQTVFSNRNSNSDNSKPSSNPAGDEPDRLTQSAVASAAQPTGAFAAQPMGAFPAPPMQYRNAATEKWQAVARELAVGRGPGEGASGGAVHVKPEALERIRLRELAKNQGRTESASGSVPREVRSG